MFQSHTLFFSNARILRHLFPKYDQFLEEFSAFFVIFHINVYYSVPFNKTLSAPQSGAPTGLAFRGPSIPTQCHPLSHLVEFERSKPV